MMKQNRGLALVWRRLGVAGFSVSLIGMGVACVPNSDTSGHAGSTGAAGISISGSAGTTGSAGTGVPTTAGSAGTGAPTSSGSAGTKGTSTGSSGSSGQPTAGSAGVSGTAGTTGAAGTGAEPTGSAGTRGPGSAGSGGPRPDAGSTDAAQTAGSSGTGTGTAGSTGTSMMSAGCGKTSTLTFQAVSTGKGAGGKMTIQSSGESRSFIVRLPDNYSNTKPYRVFFGFHWNGGTMNDVDSGGSNGYIMAHFGLQSLSNNGAIFIAPQGNGNGWANPQQHDLILVDDILKLVEDNYCVDTTHVFTNGFSYGGGMSYELACARAKVFRGAAIYEGAKLSGCDGGKDPIALWQMVGLEDTTCPMSLATPIRDQFVANNGCTPQSPPQPAKGPPYSKTMGHICTDYAGCSAGHPLRWCVHQSGHGNAIVDGTNSVYNECATPPKMCSDSCPCSWVPADVWKFFSAL
jgi:poly(3-hydroxybutyrate) depolymerase